MKGWMACVIAGLSVVGLPACQGDDSELTSRYEDAARNLHSALCDCTGSDCSDPPTQELECEQRVIAEHQGQIAEQVNCAIDNLNAIAQCLEGRATCDFSTFNKCSDDVPDCGDLPANVERELERCGDHFECDDGTTIDEGWVCDGEDDCRGGEDEDDCGGVVVGPPGVLPPVMPPGVIPPGQPPGGVSCAPGQLPCSGGSACGTRCDGINQCTDGSDEDGCSCSSSEWQCTDGGCVFSSDRCDGERNCMDGTDELACGSCTGFPAGFHCANDQCVLPTDRCNGVMDCMDGGDEVACPGECGDEYFMCQSGFCVPLSQRCDGTPNCAGASPIPGFPSSSTTDEDERDCMECQEGLMLCGDGTCVNAENFCDGTQHCDDGSDEADCPCTAEQFTCTSGQCVPGDYRCDGLPDCADSSDELGC